MVIENHTLSNKVEKIYVEKIAQLRKPVKFGYKASIGEGSYGYTLETENEYLIHITSGLEDDIFENTLIHELLHCIQMQNDTPGLIPVQYGDEIALHMASTINSTVGDIDVEDQLKDLGLHSEKIDNVRFDDALEIYNDTDEFNIHPNIKNSFTALELALIKNTSTNSEHFKYLYNLYKQKNKDITDLVDEILDIIQKYGYKTPREVLRTIRRIAIASSFRNRLKIVQNGIEQEV